MSGWPSTRQSHFRKGGFRRETPVRPRSGAGDARFFARQTIWKRDEPGATSRLAVFAGLETPTGKEDFSDARGPLPRPAQLGSGTYDSFLGFVYTRQTFDWEFDLSLSHQFQGEKNGFRAGDQTRLDLSYQLRALPRRIDEDWRGFLYGVAEMSATWNETDELGGMADKQTGGSETALALGVQYITKSWILEGAYRFPIDDRMRSKSFRLKEGLVLSARRNF